MKIILAMLAAMMFAMVPAKATTVFGNLTSDHCTGSCGPQNGGFGLITVVDNDLGTGGAVGTLSFTVALINGNNFVSGGQDVTFGFDIVGNPIITYTALPTSPDLAAAQWTIVGGNPQSAGTLHADGFGDVEYGVYLEGSGNSPPRPKTLTFSISAINLDWTDLETVMVADIFSGTTGKTGFVDFTGNLSINPECVGCEVTPIPGAVWLFGSALGVGGLLLRRRRKQS